MRCKAGWLRFRAAIAHWTLAQWLVLLAFWAMLSIPLVLWGWGAWSVLSLPLFMGAIGAATWAVLAVFRPVSRFQPGRPHFIRCFTSIDNESTQGTLSLIDGVARSTWTCAPEDGEKRTVDGLLDATRFRAIWARARSTPALKRLVPKHQLDDLDFRHNVVLSFEFVVDGQHVFTTFLIPHQGAAAAVDELLQDIRSTRPRDVFATA